MTQQKNSQGDTSDRGFASMDEDKQREIASQGGQASHGGGNSSNQNSSNQGSNSKQSNQRGRSGSEQQAGQQGNHQRQTETSSND